MNVLDYAIKVGKLLRKTDEGRALLEIKDRIDEKNRDDNIAFSQYIQLVREKETQFYFYAWDAAYQMFINVLNDEAFEHREAFLKTAELIKNDEEVKEIISKANAEGAIFNTVSSLCLLGGIIDNEVPKGWKYKMKNAISDVQLSVQRTLLVNTLAELYSRNNDMLTNDLIKQYLDEREKTQYLPFSNEAIKCSQKYNSLSSEEFMLYEKMYLIREAINKGIFYGFWGNINEITEKDLLDGTEFDYGALKEISFTHVNNACSFSKSWLYKIWKSDGYFYFMAHRKQIRFGEKKEESEITGIVYPRDDRRLFVLEQ